MLRNTFFAVFTVLVAATASQATIMLTQSAATPVAGTEGLVSYNLIATSNAGETINGVDTPNISIGVGMGLHQVWTPVTMAPTPTREQQLAAGVLWSDTWLPYDSHWLFDGVNNLSIGAAFSETNTGDGEVLASTGLGAPDTGYGVMGTAGDAPGAKSFTIASGLQGNNVTFGQFVMKANDNVLVDLTVLTNEGNNQAFTDFCLGANCGQPMDLVVIDAINTPVFAPGLHTHQFEATLGGDPVDPASLTWELLSFLGPGGAAPTNPASLSPTGLLSWTPNFDDLGDPPANQADWVATVRATMDTLSDEGTKTIELFIPEPASVMLLSLAMVGACGFIRRR